MGTQNKPKSTRISNMGLPFRRYSMPETVMRKYSLKRQRSVQSPTEFGIPGTKDQGCQTDFSVFTPDSATTLPLPKKSTRLGTISEKMMMRCSRCNRSSERRHSYSCKYNIVCSKCKQTWRKTSLPVSIVSVSKGGETLRKTSDICRAPNKPLFQSGSSPENKIQFDIGKIIERSSDFESDVSRDGDSFRFPDEPNIESELSRLESTQGENRLENPDSEVETTTERTTNKMFEDRILKMLDTYCPHMQCTLNMFMGSKRPHSEGSQRSQTSSDVKRPKSATARLSSAMDDIPARMPADADSGLSNGDILNLENGKSSGTQNILIIDHDNISSTENTPGARLGSAIVATAAVRNAVVRISATHRTLTPAVARPDTTIEMKTSSGLTSSSGTLDQTVSDLSRSTQDSTLSVTSLTPENQRLKTTSPLPIVLSSECILLTPIVPEQEDLNTTGSTQIEETAIETSDGPFPTVINSETTLIEPLEKGYISKKEMHNYSVHFLDSGHSDSSEEIKKVKKSQRVRIANDTESLVVNGHRGETFEVTPTTDIHKTQVDENGNDSIVGLEKDSRTNQFPRDRRKSLCPGNMKNEEESDGEKEKIDKSTLIIHETVGESDTSLDAPADQVPTFCGTDHVNTDATRKTSDDVELVLKRSSQDSERELSSRKVDMSTQFPADDGVDDEFSKSAKTRGPERRKSRREKRDAKLAEISDMVDELELREVPISSISTTTYYEGLDEFLVPRYCAAPRSVSMLVNTSSEYSSDSDLSFADSLEDRLSPVPERRPSEFTRYDNRLVRGEVAEIHAECKHKRRMRKCYAYFVTLSGEQTNIAVTTMPESIRNRLIMKEKQIRYLCRRKHSSRKVYCRRGSHRLCSKHRGKQKHTQTSPMNSAPAEQAAPETNNKATVSASVQTSEIVADKKESTKEKEDKVQNYDRIMIGFCSSNTQTSIYYSQDVTTMKKTGDTNDRTVTNGADIRTKAQNVCQSNSKLAKQDADIDERICQILLAGLKEQENGHMVFVEETQTYYSKSNVKKISTSAQTTDGVKDSATLTDLTYDCQKSDRAPGKGNESGGKEKLTALQKSEETLEKLQKINESLRKEIQDTKLRCNQGTQVNFDKVSKTVEPETHGDSYGSLLNHSSNFKQASFAEHRRPRQLEPSRNPQPPTKLQPPKSNSRLPSKGSQKRSSNLLGSKFRQKFEAIPEEKSSGSLESTEDSAEATPRESSEYLNLNYIRNKNNLRHGDDIRKPRNRNDARNGNDTRVGNDGHSGTDFRARSEGRYGSEAKNGNDLRSGTGLRLRMGMIPGTETAVRLGMGMIWNGTKSEARNIHDVKICRSATDCRLTQDAFLSESRRHTVGNVVMTEPLIYERSMERRRNTYHGPVSVSEHTLNTEHVKRAGNLNVGVSRRTGQIIGKRTSMMVGRFERVNGEIKSGDAKRDLDKYKGRAALEADEQEELLTLSRGWINFYLLRGDSQEVTAENGMHEEVFVRTPNASPADLVDQQTQNSGRSPEDELGQYTVHIHAAPESLRGNVKFPGVGLGPPAGRNHHSPPDEISLPEISSPPHSTPSSAASRSPLQPQRVDPQTLPSLALNGRKPRRSRSGAPSAADARYDADLSPPTSPKSIMSRSGELACSEQSITSSSCGSESPKFLADKRWSNHRHRADLSSSSSANSWTVTVAGNQEANTDVEMKLAFSHSQDRQKSVGSSSQQWTLTVNSKGKRDRSIEKHRDETFQCLPDLDAHHHHHHHHHQMHKKGWKHKEQTTPSAEQLALLWPAVQEIIEKNAMFQNPGGLNAPWTPKKDEDVESKLSVTGWAITPEKKPRVPTQSERDLTRTHCSRHMKQRQFSFA
ncbi:LOW QUALITY PROTEIN: uncharacterized protein [Bemisia tabaci]